MTDRPTPPFPARTWLLCMAVAVVAAEGLAAAAGMMLKGELSQPYQLAGLVIGLAAGGLIAFWLTRQQQRAAAAQPVLEDLYKTQTRLVAQPPAPLPPGLSAQNTAPPPAAPASGRADLRQALKRLENLPAMPVIAQRLLALKLDTEMGQREMLLLIEQDPQMSAKILGLANSAAVAAQRQIRTVKDAALMLGFKRVQLASVSIALLSLMSAKNSGALNMDGLWLHSFRIASALQGLARFMPKNMRPPDDETFLAGMLHDIGYMALAFLNPQQSDRLHNHLSAEPERCSLEIERELVEICHDELGAELARHWNLPENLIAVLRFHHTPDAAGAAAAQPLARMIHVTEKLLPPYGIIEYVPPGVSVEEWQALGIDPAQAEEVGAQVAEQAEYALQFARAFT